MLSATRAILIGLSCTMSFDVAKADAAFDPIRATNLRVALN
jgi:hypothetical protein